MEINVKPTKKETSKKAADKASQILQKAIKEKGKAVFVMATGASQFDFINYLTKDNKIDWSKTKMYHLDEYIGLPESHQASFRRYLIDRFISQVDELKEVNLINGEADEPEEECKRLNQKIGNEKIDVAFVGIGENGHLAFNDPPADFETEKPYIIVELDQKCREQQLGEGWFDSLAEVPQKAISMSIKQIVKAENIICTIPDKRKAEAVKYCFDGDRVSPLYPASILKNHPRTYVYLDQDSASLL